MMILRRIARIKAKMLRFNFYINIVQLVILVSLRGWRWWYILIPVGGALIYWFESKWGIRGEADVSWSQITEWQNFLKRFSELERKVNENSNS